MKTLSLKIVRDEYPQNPWKDWDSMTPLFTDGGRNYGCENYNLDIDTLLEQIEHEKVNQDLLDRFELEMDNRSDYANDFDCIMDTCRNCIDDTVENIQELARYMELPYYQWTSV